jgi:hypothetical protein
MKGKKKEAATRKVKGGQEPLQLRTPYYGKSLASHTCHTVALFKGQSPSTSHQKLMVEKLARAAETATAENVILWSEIERLQQQTVEVAGIVKTRSRKMLSPALLVTAENVVRLIKQRRRDLINIKYFTRLKTFIKIFLLYFIAFIRLSP